jgi:periplasmic protein TonB
MMNAPLLSPVSCPAGRAAQTTVSWGAAVKPEPVEKKMSALGLGVFAIVFFVHLLGLALLVTQTLSISAPEQASAGNGPLSVRLVSSKPEAVESPPPLKPPPKPQPQQEKKILASEAPSPRVVEAPKTEPAPMPVPTPVQQAVAVPAAAPKPVAPVVPTLGPAVAAGKPNTLDLGAAPKEVGQIECRVPKPEYPRSARRRGETGTVSMRLTVDERGQVIAVIDRSSGFPDLDTAARQAALSAQCQPYIEAGRAIRVTALQEFTFVPSN